MNAGHELKGLVDRFAAEIVVLAKREALRQVAAAFGVSSAPGAATATGVLDAEVRSGRPGRRDASTAAQSGRRTTGELAALKRRITEQVQATPGQRTEQLNAVLRTSTSELARPLRQLVADGVFRTEGQRRGMTYHLADGASRRGRRT